MKTITTSLIIAFLLFCLEGKSQERELPRFISKVHKSFSRFVDEKIVSQMDSNLRSLCLESASFAKFTITKEGKVKNISFTEKTPPEIVKAYKSVLFSTDGLWEPESRNGEAVDSEPLLLPIVFSFSSRCEGEIQQNFYTPLIGMLNFDDGIKFEQLRCIILPTSIVYSMR